MFIAPGARPRPRRRRPIGESSMIDAMIDDRTRAPGDRPLSAGRGPDARPAAIGELGATPAADPLRNATPQAVVAVRRWTDALVGVRVTRDAAFRFTPGHYARLGLARGDGVVVSRPLSIASAASEPHLDFLCTVVPGGEFSARLDGCRAGDVAFVERASYGFLTVGALAPGGDLWLLATGTGIAPFLSILGEARVWSSFERVVVVHSVRCAAELAPAAPLAARARSPAAAPGSARLAYMPIATREPGATPLAARIPALLADGRLESAVGVELDAGRSRVMACGNPSMIAEVRGWLDARGFRPARRGAPGQMAFEHYWQRGPASERASPDAVPPPS